MLAPLMQWQTTHQVIAIYVHLKQKYFEFQGFYAAPRSCINRSTRRVEASDVRQHRRRAARRDHDHRRTRGDRRSPKIGPSRRARSRDRLLRLVQLAPRRSSIGAVLAIKPGATAPSIAVPGHGDEMRRLPTLSGDGATLFVGTAVLRRLFADLRNNGAQLASYTGNASDGTSKRSQVRLVGGLPDGTFRWRARITPAKRTHTTRHLFRRSDATQIAAMGWTAS